jgi:hypothetical protein
MLQLKFLQTEPTKFMLTLRTSHMVTPLSFFNINFTFRTFFKRKLLEGL